MRWVQRQTAWVRSQCAGRDRATSAGREARFWAAVCLVLQQHDGLAEGYRAAAAAAGGASRRRLDTLSDDDLLFVQSNADLYDIIDWM